MDDDTVNRHMFIAFDWAIDMERHDRWTVKRPLTIVYAFSARISSATRRSASV